MNEETRPGEVRKDLYAYLESQGFKVTDARHKAIKTAIILHTNAVTAAEKRDRENALNALQNMQVAPKIQTIINRIKKKQCSACGLDLKKIEEHTYEAVCGHYPQRVRIIIG